MFNKVEMETELYNKFVQLSEQANSMIKKEDCQELYRTIDTMIRIYSTINK